MKSYGLKAQVNSAQRNALGKQINDEPCGLKAQVKYK